jgi:hypothetical protein
MSLNLVTQLSSAYLRLQADRCQRLSRNCMDLGTARDLRLMSEEYLAEATKLEAIGPGA